MNEGFNELQKEIDMSLDHLDQGVIDVWLNDNDEDADARSNIGIWVEFGDGSQQEAFLDSLSSLNKAVKDSSAEPYTLSSRCYPVFILKNIDGASIVAVANKLYRQKIAKEKLK